MTEQDAIAAILEAQNAAKAREVQMAAAMAADKTIVSDTDTTFREILLQWLQASPTLPLKRKVQKKIIS